jgi:hypothetical protein
MPENLNELFAPPVGLKLVDVVDGMKLYSSAKMFKKFLLAFEKSSRGKDKVELIDKMMQKGLVVPCFKSKGIFKFLKHKAFGSADSKSIMGLYHLESKRVYVIIDNNSTVFGTSSNDELVSTTLHEIMHLSAGTDMKGYLKIMMPTLREYYSAAFTAIFALKSVPNIDNIIYHIATYEDPRKVNTNKKLSEYYHLLFDTFSEYTQLDGTAFKLKLQDYIVSMKIFMVSLTAFVRSYRKWSSMFTELNNAYVSTFGSRNTYTTPFQELVSVSEVACVMAEMRSTDSRVKSILKLVA